MGAEGMEPMAEIFLGEMSGLISELRECIEEGRGSGSFSRSQVEDIFRDIHTMKADSAMMLYENISRPSKTLENVLYFFRDETDGVTDMEGFLKLMDEMLSFYQGEFTKMMDGSLPDGDSTELTDHILSYLKKIKGGESTEQEEAMEDDSSEGEQFFYIGSGEDGIIKTIHRTVKNQLPEKTAELAYTESEGEVEPKRPKHILVSSDEIDYLDHINLRLLKFANTMSIEVQSLLRELDNWLWRVHSTDFTLMAAKLDMTVKDMLQHMDKQVEFHVTGSEVIVEKAKIDKISNAMIHLVRNAVDHGIESPQERRECGKSRCGHVSVDIEDMQEPSGLRIRVSDDGYGMDMYQILDRAQQENLLEKPYGEYTEQEAFDFIFHPGFTTCDEAGEYSGQGVGMDVVRHNLKEIGGTIHIESVYGVGTSFIMEIAYDTHIGNDDRARRRTLIDESINSRR